jgi:hypothetical protein
MKKSELRQLIHEVIQENLPPRESIATDVRELLHSVEENMLRRMRRSGNMDLSFIESVVSGLAHELIKGGWKKGA